jgi:hypothetical protein
VIAPDVAAAVALDPYVIGVVFTDGQVRDVDIEPFLGGSVFAPLRDRAEFARVTVDEQTGAVAWPNGADLDPDVIYASSRSASTVSLRVGPGGSGTGSGGSRCVLLRGGRTRPAAMRSASVGVP